MDSHRYVLMSLSLPKLCSHTVTVTGIVNKILDVMHKLGNVVQSSYVLKYCNIFNSEFTVFARK
jgi:hypothetical protein